MRTLAEDFLLSDIFNPFLTALLKDIRMERDKVRETDHLRLLFVTRWWTEFFLGQRASSTATSTSGQKWTFSLISQILERDWILWVLKRIREASEEKPKAWTEIQAGVECLGVLIGVIDSMFSVSSSGSSGGGLDTGAGEDAGEDPEELRDTAQTLLASLTYSGSLLDITFDSLKSYQEGTQRSLVYLEKAVELGYGLLRVLERWSSGGAGGSELVRLRKKQRKKRTKKKAVEEGEVDMDGEDEEMEEDDKREEALAEMVFTFEAFELVCSFVISISEAGLINFY